MNILAGAKTDLVWTGSGFEGEGEGPVFTIQTLDYFAAQGVLEQEKDADKIKACLESGLVAIDGDEQKAKEFLGSPLATVVTPLFDRIWTQTWGNSEAHEESE